MEGFRYRLLKDMDNQFPVINYEAHTKQVSETVDFPVLPVGMRALWEST